MLSVKIISPDGETTSFSVPKRRCIIGKDKSSDIVLSSWKVSKQHAEIVSSQGALIVRDLSSMGGTFVNDQRVTVHGPLKDTDHIKIGSYSVWASVDASEMHRRAASVESQLGNASTSQNSSAETQENMASKVERDDVEVAAHVSPESRNVDVPAPRTALQTQEYLNAFKWRKVIHERLLETFDLRRTDVNKMSDAELRRQTTDLIRDIIKKDKSIPSDIDSEQLLLDVLNEAIGLGPLEPLLADATITEIMVNKSDEIFVERLGKLQKCPVAFTSDRAVFGVIERIVAPLGRRIDESSPMVDARLKDGSRVNAIVHPLALKGPSLTIRKFSKEKLKADDLRKFGSANAEMLEFLRICVEYRKNVVISGGTGSGKTTLLNILSNFIPPDERVVTIEDAAELQLRHENLVTLEARPANLEGRGQVSIRDLVKNSLRMRPDRIVIGECRGGEALDMLQAMNTGHDGSLTTAHANTPRDMLSRLEVMVLMAGMDLPVSAIREQIASAVDIVVQQTRFACGTRKITHITEVTGVESGKIQLQNIFTYVQTGVDKNGKVDGYFTGCGFIPEFYEQMVKIGTKLDTNIFSKKEDPRGA